ncbi:hypothetical protein NUITMVR1_36900 [Raoultella ornithinolytica]|nr:hypothetical protein NUITMVR1_36900 [Raoultella ornithinolytica]
MGVIRAPGGSPGGAALTGATKGLSGIPGGVIRAPGQVYRATKGLSGRPDKA